MRFLIEHEAYIQAGVGAAFNSLYEILQQLIIKGIQRIIKLSILSMRFARESSRR